jgi:cysteinyl-tRNA synthetase
VVLDAIARKANRGTKSAASCLAASLEFLGLGSNSLLKGDGATDFDVEAIVADRLTRLKNKEFAEADRIRAELAAQGIQLMDYKDPATGERRTRWEVRR